MSSRTVGQTVGCTFDGRKKLAASINGLNEDKCLRDSFPRQKSDDVPLSNEKRALESDLGKTAKIEMGCSRDMDGSNGIKFIFSYRKLPTLVEYVK